MDVIGFQKLIEVLDDDNDNDKCGVVLCPQYMIKLMASALDKLDILKTYFYVTSNIDDFLFEMICESIRNSKNVKYIGILCILPEYQLSLICDSIIENIYINNAIINYKYSNTITDILQKFVNSTLTRLDFTEGDPLNDTANMLSMLFQQQAPDNRAKVEKYISLVSQFHKYNASLEQFSIDVPYREMNLVEFYFTHTIKDMCTRNTHNKKILNSTLCQRLIQHA